jgi:hypothetical protein
MRMSESCRIVYQVVVDAGPSGITVEEADAIHPQAKRRTNYTFTWLKRKGYIVKVGERESGSAGAPMGVYAACVVIRRLKHNPGELDFEAQTLFGALKLVEGQLDAEGVLEAGFMTINGCELDVPPFIQVCQPDANYSYEPTAAAAEVRRCLLEWQSALGFRRPDFKSPPDTVAPERDV